ncbi:CD151 antigen [Paragonimus westermani]|uniref:CD151 antigen n=1 Tax=Paragonimus westermani TaxID=34504 RepID=A0A5J4ND50_9TREM|nr:CD151 antigen [Paragonimus westermani]
MGADDRVAVRKPLMSHEGEIVQDDSKCCSCTPSWVKTFLIFFTAIILFCLMLGIVLFLQLATGILALCFSELFQGWLASRLQFTMQNNYAASDSNVGNAVDFVQQKFKCCGSLGFRDWKSSIFHNSTDSDFERRDILNYGMRVPDSCCIRKVEDCGYLPHPSNVRHQGCIDSIFGRLRDRYYTICVVALTLIIVEFIGVILACCYAEALKQQR